MNRWEGSFVWLGCFFFFELCNSLITTLYILFPCTFLFAFVLSNNILLMLRSNIGSVGSFGSLLSFLLPSLALTAGSFDAFFELSSILWAFAWLISHHILISERISLGRGQRNTPLHLQSGIITHWGMKPTWHKQMSPIAPTSRGILAGCQRNFPLPNRQSLWQVGFFFCFSLWSDAVMV